MPTTVNVASRNEVNPRTKPALKLYWCTTRDHCEDWFVVASNRRVACRYHEAAEGFDPHEADAELIMKLPDELQRDADARQGWPSERTLLSCGAEFIKDGPRVVRLKGRLFAEGSCIDFDAYEIELDRLHKTGLPVRLERCLR